MGAASGDKVGKHVKTSFDTMRFIVTVGWSIYPLGYFFGYLMGQVNDDVLNLVYDLADFVNKIAFCLAIWQSAKNDTHERSGSHEPSCSRLFVCGQVLPFSNLAERERFLLDSPAPLPLPSANRQRLGDFTLAR